MNYLNILHKIQIIYRQSKKLENETNLLKQIVRAAIVLAKKYLSARDQSKKLLKSESDQMQLLIKEIAKIKSKI